MGALVPRRGVWTILFGDVLKCCFQFLQSAAGVSHLTANSPVARQACLWFLHTKTQVAVQFPEVINRRFILLRAGYQLHHTLQRIHD